MQAILKEDPEGFVRREMTERKEFGYPPFTHLAVVLISHEDGEVALQKAQRVQEFLQGVVEHLKAERSLYLFGPVFAPIQRLKNKTRLQILLKSSERSLLHRVLDHFDGFVSEQNEWGSISLDVDPINLL